MTFEEEVDAVTPEEVGMAILKMFNALLLLYKFDGTVPSWDPEAEPIQVPFADTVDEAVEAFDKPALRRKLTQLLWPNGYRNSGIQSQGS